LCGSVPVFCKFNVKVALWPFPIVADRAEGKAVIFELSEVGEAAGGGDRGAGGGEGGADGAGDDTGVGDGGGGLT
jgi:hypothetical protein